MNATRVIIIEVFLAWSIGIIAPSSYAGDHVVITSNTPDRSRTTDEEEFIRQDRNGDGVISQSEWFESPGEFYQLDYNHDGVLTRSEYLGRNRGAFPPSYGPRDAFSALDSDHNGLITQDEWNANPNEFYQLDYNRDGALSRSEFFGQDANGNGFVSQQEFRGRGYAGQRLPRVSPARDINGDGVISRDEWNSDSAYFDQLDRNQDRVLTRDEVENRQSQDGTGQVIQTILDGLLRKR